MILGVRMDPSEMNAAVVDGVGRILSRGRPAPNEEQAVLLYQKGRLLHDQGREEEAAWLYRQAVSLHPLLAEAYNDLGTLAQSRGRFQEAILFYRTALSLKPRFPEACYNLGNTYKEMKAWEEAENYCRQALALDPHLVEALFTLGVIVHEGKRVEEALRYWLEVVKLKPDHLQAHLNIASVYYLEKRYPEAEAFYQKALALNPTQALPWLGLGKIKEDRGEREDAEICYRQALTLDPYFPETYVRLGSLALEKGEAEQAVTYYEQALRLNPANAECYGLLGNAYQKKEAWGKASEYFLKAIQLKPDYYQAYNNLGLILHAQGRFEQSREMYEKAIALCPDKPELRVNLGNLYKEEGRIAEAVAQFRKVIAEHPDFPYAHWNLSLALLAAGQFEEGWREYEYRLMIHEYLYRKEIPFPLWKGEDIRGKRILLHQEQGIGDTLQFVRYIPLLAQRGGEVILQCQKEIISLLTSIPGCHGIVSFEEEVPPCDYHCPLLSLPRFFKTDLSNLPAEVPYLFADPVKVEGWRRLLCREGDRPKIGLVWAGRPEYVNDRNRSISLEAFQPLLRLRGITWISLQKGKAAGQIQEIEEGRRILDYTDALKDFSDTAGLIENLDLVISVDTSVAHLAGALGKPVWTLISFAPDWRWLLDRDDSPWYPTMRLFRQTRYGDWKGVMERVAEALVEHFSLHGKNDEPTNTLFT